MKNNNEPTTEINKELNKKDINSAKECALHYLSYRQRTIWEVKRRLFEKGYDKEITSFVIAFLQEYGFIDDEKFALMWIRSRTGERPTGKKRVYQELLKKGVNKEIIERILESVSPEKEEEMISRLVQRKCHKSGFDYKKIYGFLVRRGFHPEMINRVLYQFELKHK